MDINSTVKSRTKIHVSKHDICSNPQVLHVICFAVNGVFDHERETVFCTESQFFVTQLLKYIPLFFCQYLYAY